VSIWRRTAVHWLRLGLAALQATNDSTNHYPDRPFSTPQAEFRDRPIDLKANKAMADAVCAMFKCVLVLVG
jgi:hypothetical protein